ncbi:MAG: transcriptional regulator [Anaerolinea sp. 4484_236]|nr:MAG: transcriptional regulator [Anaerolinea sp. 4484_236]
MSTNIKSGNLSDFFDSARETAKEIDAGQKTSPKNTIWVDSKDFRDLLKPERTDLIQFLRQNNRVVFSELMQAMERSPASLNKDLGILSKYQLIRVFKEPNPGHGMRKVIESTFDNEPIRMVTEI